MWLVLVVAAFWGSSGLLLQAPLRVWRGGLAPPKHSHGHGLGHGLGHGHGQAWARRSSTAVAAAAAAAAAPQAAGDEWEQLRATLRGTNVYFIGMMGSGKSTVGKAFANELGYRFLDTDEAAEFMIEPVTIAEFFAAGNESQFRDIEYQVLMEMSQYTRLVLATGGGIVERNDNWGLLHHGVVVFLDLSPTDIFNRLSADPAQVAKRPLLAGPPNTVLAKLQELSDRRIDRYAQADVRVTVPVTAGVEEVSSLVRDAILRHVADNPPKWLEWKKKRDAAMIVGGAAGTGGVGGRGGGGGGGAAPVQIDGNNILQ